MTSQPNGYERLLTLTNGKNFMTSRRRSQIGRLPKAVREHVNQMLDDGATNPQVAAWLAEQGHGDFNHMVISRWRNGGFQDWLTHQERLADRQQTHELAVEHAASGDQVYHDAGVNIVAQEFYVAFSRINFDELAARARENPDKIVSLLKAFIQFNAYCLRRDKYRNDLQRQQKADDANKPREPVTPENLDMLCEKFGLK